MSMGESRKNHPYLFWIRIIVAVSLLASLIWFAGPENVLASLKLVDPFLLIVCAITLLVFLLIGSINIWWLIRCRHEIAYSEFLQCYAYGLSLGLLSPGQVGDAALVLFLRNRDVSVRLSSAAYTVDKLISLSVMAIITLYGLYHYQFLDVVEIFFLLAISAATISACGYFIRHDRLDNRVFRIVRDVFSEASEYRSHATVVFGNIALTVFKWLVLCAAYYAAFKSFGTETPWPDIGVIPVMAGLVGYIPISIGGVGTVEISAVFLFKLIGIAEAAVISAYILIRVLVYALALSVMLLLRDDVSAR